MNFYEQVTSLIRAAGSLQDLGRGLARVLDQGTLRGFILYGAPERCLVTVPYVEAVTQGELRDRFERTDWRWRPREALLSVFAALGVPTGEVGESIRWSYLGSEESPLGAFAFVRDPAAPPPGEAERKTTEFFCRLSAELALWTMRKSRRESEVREKDYLLDALNQLGRLMFASPDRTHLLPSLLKVALDVARTEVGSILLLTDGRFAGDVEWGLSGDLVQGIRFLPEGDGVIDRIRETREPVIIDDVSGPSVQVPQGFPVRISTLVALPLLAGSRLIGVLNVATGEEGREVLRSTLAALNTIAVLIATAVENARLGEALAERATEAQPKLNDEQRLLRQVLSTLSEGVLVSDTAGCIVMANPAAEEMLGLSPSGGGRYPERNVVTLRPFFAWLRGRWAACAKTEVVEYPLAVNPPAVLGAIISPLRVGSDRLSHVTVLRELSAAGAGGAAGTDSGLRIAPEIEKPLAALRIALAVLPQSEAPEDRLFRSIARRGIDRLAALTEDLREQALRQTASLELSWSEFDLAEVVAEAGSVLYKDILEKRIAYRGPDPAARAPVIADRERLGRAISRFLDAGVRFAAEEGWMRVALAPGEGSWRLSIQVLLGPGAQEFERVFDSAAGSRGEEQAGAFGLAAARGIVEMHGGCITLDVDEPLEGHLQVEIPRGTRHTPPAEPAESKEEEIGVDLSATSA